MRKLIFLILLTAPPFVFSAFEDSDFTQVKEIYSYSEYGGGDVIIKLASNSQNCKAGYWLKKENPGFQANLSMVIAAYQAKNRVVFTAHTDRLWPGLDPLENIATYMRSDINKKQPLTWQQNTAKK